MDIREAQRVCDEVESKYCRTTKWDEIYSSEEEILNDLAKVYVPKNRIAPVSTFRGYEFIYSFAFYVQKGWKLSDKQMVMCKRLAKEIKKAAAIAEYRF